MWQLSLQNTLIQVTKWEMTVTDKTIAHVTKIIQVVLKENFSMILIYKYQTPILKKK